MEKEKETIELNSNEGLVDWKDISGKPNGKEPNQIDKKGFINSINANTIKGGEITGTKFQTSKNGARVIIGGVGEDSNDITLVDETNGGTTPITGNTASIDFARSDDSTQKFIIQKRSGVNDDDENVMEMFFDKAANDNQNNWFFIGKKGDTTTSYTDRIWARGNEYVALSVKNSSDIDADGVALYSSYAFPTIVDEGASRVDISYNQADTPDNIDFTDYSGGGGIMFHRATPSTSTQSIMAAFDKDGLKLFSPNGTQSGYLTVNNSTGALEWNGTPIS